MIFQDPLSVEADKADVPFSILDTDLYKLTMQNAVLHHFSDAVVRIKFTNRAPQMLFSRESFHWIQDHVNQLERLRLSDEERTALAQACPYFSNKYLDFLASIQLHPREQVGLRFIPKSEDERMGEIECTIEGLWRECILYEVPIMSILSEAYFKFVDQDWNMEGVKDKAKRKALQLLSPPAPTQPLLFSEFGTRRRRSFYIHDLVVQGLKEGQDEWVAGGGKGGGLAGTSNVYLALKHGLKPMGTIAHEWIMAIGAVYGYKGSNGRAMDMWEEVYPRGDNAAPLTMLTDTFTANAFFDDFAADTTRALRWDSLRQDSGDAFAFVKQAKEVWRGIEQEAGVKHNDGAVAVGKRVIFSDGLDVESAIALQKGCDEIGIAASFGIGTYLTNDFSKVSDSTKISKPLNIVIKLSRIDGHDCVKLSDDKGKYTGDLEEVKRVQRELNLVDQFGGQRRA